MGLYIWTQRWKFESDWVRAYVQLDIKEKEALLACM